MPRRPRSGDAFYRALGSAIHQQRKMHHLSLEALGKEVGGLARATVSGIEKGRQRIDAYQLYLFSRALDVALEELIADAVQTGGMTEGVRIATREDGEKLINVSDL